MLVQQIIAKKRDGHTLNKADIGFMVDGICSGKVSDAQLGAFAMAVYLQGMDMPERITLTEAMMHSGRVLNWQSHTLHGPIVDKHSTGGVGDKVSLLLAPLVAACGAYVPMISGRGLGHTGGTLDKLESLSGYNAYPEEKKFKQLVADIGCAIIGQTDDLAPADRRFYATRDVSATVESIPLITASILSKKLTANLDALVMDVKTGSGAFARELNMAQQLAHSIATVSHGAGVACRCLITDMNQVLGTSVGNAVEVQEVLQGLTNPHKCDQRLLEVTMALSANMLCLSGLSEDMPMAHKKLQHALDSGHAAEIFATMCRGMGVHDDVLKQHAHNRLFDDMPIVAPILATKTGFIEAMDTKPIGLAMVAIGAGRGYRYCGSWFGLNQYSTRWYIGGTRPTISHVACENPTSTRLVNVSISTSHCLKFRKQYRRRCDTRRIEKCRKKCRAIDSKAVNY